MPLSLRKKLLSVISGINKFYWDLIILPYQNLVYAQWIGPLRKLNLPPGLTLRLQKDQTPRFKSKFLPPGKTESVLKIMNIWEMSSSSSTKMAVESLTLRKLSRFLKKLVWIREILMLSKLFGPWEKQTKVFHSKNSLTSYATKSVNTKQKMVFNGFGSFTTVKTQEWSDSIN